MNSIRKKSHVAVGMATAMMAIVIPAFTLIIAATTSAAGVPGLSRTLPLVRMDGTTVGESGVKNLPRGTVKLKMKGNTQRVTIDAYNMSDSFDPGLAAYIGDSPQITNATMQYVGVLSRVSSNGHWRLKMESSNNQAPPQFVGFNDLTQLEGWTFFIVAGQGNALLRANVTTLVPKPSAMSYRGRVRLAIVDPTLSPKGRGYILVKYNGRTGGSVVTLRAAGLNKGNRYVAGAPTGEPITPEECNEFGFMAEQGKTAYGYDTRRGDELPFGGSETGITTALDLAGIPLVVQDCFGGVHLFGTIPGP